MAKKRVRIFAGPNGSGKSYLIESLKDSSVPLGPVVNADSICEMLKSRSFIDLRSEFGLKGITESDWDSTFTSIPEIVSRSKQSDDNISVSIENDILRLTSPLNNLSCALIADTIRYLMLERQKKNFSFETVFSHPAKLEFMDAAHRAGYIVYLYFICTDDVDINIINVSNRVVKGGHDVPEDRIMKRYRKSLELIPDAYKVADRVFLIDNSLMNNDVVIEKMHSGDLKVYQNELPDWINDHFISKL